MPSRDSRVSCCPSNPKFTRISGARIKKTSLWCRAARAVCIKIYQNPPGENGAARAESGAGNGREEEEGRDRDRDREREREREKSLLAKTLFPRLSRMCSDRQKSRPPAGHGVSIAHSLHICKHRNRSTFERKYGVREVRIFLYYQYRPRAFRRAGRKNGTNARDRIPSLPPPPLYADRRSMQTRAARNESFPDFLFFVFFCFFFFFFFCFVLFLPSFVSLDVLLTAVTNRKRFLPSLLFSLFFPSPPPSLPPFLPSILFRCKGII